MTQRSTMAAFSLIELMVALVIVGILAAFGYPAFTRHTTEARRSDAQVALAHLAADLQKFYDECGGRYTQVIVSPNRSCANPAPNGGLGRTTALTVNGYYLLAVEFPPIAGVPAGGFRLTATPQGIQATRDTDCQVMRLTNTSTTSATGPSSRCWSR